MLKDVITYLTRKSVLPQNVNCCDIRETKNRYCKHEPSDMNEDCVCCSHFIWIRVYNSFLPHQNFL